MRNISFIILLLLALALLTLSFVPQPSISIPNLQPKNVLFFANSDDKPRRRKVNKYRKDSSDDAKDPMELLMEESQKKLEQLNREDERRGRLKNPQNDDIAKLKNKELRFDFPDNKDIDPNDPSSFGFIEIGTIVGPHGVKGEIKVQSSSDFPRRFTDPGIRYLKPPNKRAPRKVVLRHGKPSKEGEYILQLEDVLTRDEAKHLRGSTLYIREEDRDAGSSNSTDDDFFISDLIGLEVFLRVEEDVPEVQRASPFVGHVVGVVFAEEMCAIPGLGHDMLEINLPRGKGGTTSLRDELVLIPFVPEIVPNVDISQGAIFIAPPPGLLDLTYIREEKIRIKAFLPPAD